MKYDFLIVGAGFAGATCARLLSDKGYKCIIIEERPFVGGNCVTNNINGIDVHITGPHVFHTNNKKVWDFVNIYDSFINYKHSVYTFSDGALYPNSYNLSLLHSIYGFDDAKWPEQYKKILIKDLETININQPSNLEEYCKKKFGEKIYNTILKGFYEKKYNLPCNELPISVLEEYDVCNYLLSNNFYNDKYQGIPTHGYTLLIEKIIGDIPIMLNTNFIANSNKLTNIANYIIYTGEIDRLLNYCIGHLGWISTEIQFSEETKNTNNLFGNSVINFVDKNIPYYRATEHKWFNAENALHNNSTLITYEYFKEWKPGDIAYFCLQNDLYMSKYKQYKQYLKNKYKNMFLCGKMAEYKNMSMAETIESAFNLCNIIEDIL